MSGQLPHPANTAPQGTLPAGRKILCLFHDIEGPVDSPVSAEACHSSLADMLCVEKAECVSATYNVLGTVWRDKVPLIRASGPHALGFHSYNHQIEDLQQLSLCRQMDPEVRGYRPPKSQLTPEVSDLNLCRYHFHWLLSSTSSFGFADVRLESGIVKIPVHLDDYPIHCSRLGYDEWEQQLLHLVESRDFVSFGLHDCYAHLWKDGYGKLLARLRSAGEFWTCDAIAEHFRSQCI